MVATTSQKLHRFIKHLVYSSACLALALLLPFLTGQIPAIGSALCPMHIPVLLCGYLCGAPWALLVGFMAPPLRYFLFSMPPFPTNAAMAVELAAYGLFAGLLYRRLPKTRANIYLSLLISMVLGRICWAAARALLAEAFGSPLTLPIFLASAFTNAIPGILCQIILIPLLVMALKKANILED